MEGAFERGIHMNNFTFCVPTSDPFRQRPNLAFERTLRKAARMCCSSMAAAPLRRAACMTRPRRFSADAGLHVVELSGIEPNPRIESVREGARLCKEHAIDMVLAVGGGSVIDAAKGYRGCCEIRRRRVGPGARSHENQGCVARVFRAHACGYRLEMDPFAVISDLSKNEKWGTASPLFVPKMSVLDPTYTFSVSKKQTARWHCRYDEPCVRKLLHQC